MRIHLAKHPGRTHLLSEMTRPAHRLLNVVCRLTMHIEALWPLLTVGYMLLIPS